jgi:hypothetical protein
MNATSGPMTEARTKANPEAGLILLCGLYLILAPWIMGFGGAADLAVSNTVTGLALALLAAGRTMASARFQPLTWVLPVLGLWAAVSPFVIPASDEQVTPPTTAGVVGNIVAGALIVGAGLMMIARARRTA